jgi:hypothetical protein
MHEIVLAMLMAMVGAKGGKPALKSICPCSAADKPKKIEPLFCAYTVKPPS